MTAENTPAWTDVGARPSRSQIALSVLPWRSGKTEPGAIRTRRASVMVRHTGGS